METYKKVIWGSAIVAIIVIVSLVVFVFIPGNENSNGESAGKQTGITTPSPTPISPKEITTDETGAVDVTPLDIPLNDSDPKIRELLQTASSDPGFSKWLENSDLIRKTVATVDNIANGESPRNHVSFLAPKKRFKVIERNGRILLDPASYHRYDNAVNIFCSLDSKALGTLYLQVKPQVNQAFTELGYPKDSFNSTLIMAIDRLLDVPIVETDITLKEKVTTYVFTDPKLERLSMAQKHLLRMGPENIKKIQQKLKEIAAACCPGD